MGREMRGGQHQALLLARGLVKRGHACTLLTRPGSPLWQSGLAVGLDVGLATLGNVWARSAASDIVHAHDAHAHTLCVMASRRPVAVSRRVAFPIGRSWTSRLKYRRPARYLAISQFVGAQLEAAGVLSNKIDVVYDSVELPDVKACAWSAEGPVVALASRDPLKGRQTLEQVVQLFGIPIVFSSNLVDHLAGASMFVYVSHSEGLGSAALLAMARGVPVIASRVGGLAEVVQHEETGLLVDNKPAEIASAIARLRKEPGLAERLASGAYSRVEREFTVDQMVARTVASYLKVVDG